MTDAPIRMSSLLGETRETVDAALAAAIAQRGDRPVIENALHLVGDSVDQGVRKACDQDLGALLVRGWSVATELGGYADPAKYPAERIVRVALADHSMTMAIDPHLSLAVSGLPLLQLGLVVEFDARIVGAVLIIQAAAITAFEAGSVTLTARLRWGTVALPLKLDTYEVTIPGRVRLAKPVRLGALSRAGQNDA